MSGETRVPAVSLADRAAAFLGLRTRGQRRFERHPVCIPSGLLLIGRSYDLVGVVHEISQGGALFREASDFILDRNGTRAELKLPELTVSVVIVASRASGYGVRFIHELPDETLVMIVEEYGLGRS
jgi:hypothetical protein